MRPSQVDDVKLGLPVFVFHSCIAAFKMVHCNILNVLNTKMRSQSSPPGLIILSKPVIIWRCTNFFCSVSKCKIGVKRSGQGPEQSNRQNQQADAKRGDMAETKEPVTIKKYANRRLYNTGSSSYVTLEDLAEMVKLGEDFLVVDAKSGDDITRSVLAQIIFEQEGKTGQSLLPISFLRQLIRFYGDSMQMLVPSYLEFSIDKLTSQQAKMREKVTGMVGAGPEQAKELMGALEEQTKKNMAMFSQALTMFNPFAGSSTSMSDAEDTTGTTDPGGGQDDIKELQAQMAEMQRKLEGITRKN